MFQSDNSRFNSAQSVQLIRVLMRRNESLRVDVTSMGEDGTNRFFTQYGGLNGGPLTVLFYGMEGDSPQDSTLLEIDTNDPRKAVVYIPSSVAFRYRFGKLRFSCIGTDKTTGLSTTLLRGEITFMN